MCCCSLLVCQHPFNMTDLPLAADKWQVLHKDLSLISLTHMPLKVQVTTICYSQTDTIYNTCTQCSRTANISSHEVLHVLLSSNLKLYGEPATKVFTTQLYDASFAALFTMPVQHFLYPLTALAVKRSSTHLYPFSVMCTQRQLKKIHKGTTQESKKR